MVNAIGAQGAYPGRRAIGRRGQQRGYHQDYEEGDRGIQEL